MNGISDRTIYQNALTQIADHEGAVAILSELNIDPLKMGTQRVNLNFDKFAGDPAAVAPQMLNLLAFTPGLKLEDPENHQWIPIFNEMNVASLTTDEQKAYVIDNLKSQINPTANQLTILKNLGEENYEEARIAWNILNPFEDQLPLFADLS